MPRKPKFRPRVTRVKLNPEQAVLTCSCWGYGRVSSACGGGSPCCATFRGGTNFESNPSLNIATS